MSTTVREAWADSRPSRGDGFMGKSVALLAIRLLVSVNLLYAAIFLKFETNPWTACDICVNRATEPGTPANSG
jgi:hypothetical protein